MNKISIFYFSGTGNTKLLVDALAKYFIEKNYKIKTYPIETYDIKKHNLEEQEIIALFFPVAIFLTYPFVKKFINKLPKSNKNLCFTILSMGAFSLGLKSHLKYILLKKNYIPFLYKEILMPDNYFLHKLDKKDIIIKKAMATLNTICHEIQRTIENKNLIKLSYKWNYYSFFHHIINALSSFAFYISKKNNKYIKLNKNLCIKCGLCENICPVKNIKLIPYPKFLAACEQCARCYNYCPQAALYRKKNEKKYTAIDVKNLSK